MKTTFYTIDQITMSSPQVDQNEKFVAALKEISYNSVSMAQKVGGHVRELSSISIDMKLSDKEKLSKIKLSILEYRSTPIVPNENAAANEAVETTLGSLQGVKDSSLCDHNKMIAESHKLELLTHAMQTGLSEVKKHEVLLANIKAILVEKTLNEEERVSAIQTLLL